MWVATTVDGSTTVQPADSARGRSGDAIHLAGRPKVGSRTDSPLSAAVARPLGSIASRRPARISPAPIFTPETRMR
jgi:hypothetical protein